jgi:hypothetical protein
LFFLFFFLFFELKTFQRKNWRDTDAFYTNKPNKRKREADDVATPGVVETPKRRGGLVGGFVGGGVQSGAKSVGGRVAVVVDGSSHPPTFVKVAL